VTVTEDNAKRLQCKFVVEAANGPTTPAGDAVLRERGIVVLPDIYTNGGGVTVRSCPCKVLMKTPADVAQCCLPCTKHSRPCCGVNPERTSVDCDLSSE
jgi:hypothetical protein